MVCFACLGAVLPLLSAGPELAQFRAQMLRIALVPILVTFVVGASTVLATVQPSLEVIVAACHGVVFGFAAVAIFVWGGKLLLRGIPSGSFRWSLGYFSFVTTYGSFVASRTLGAARIESSFLVRNGYLLVALASLAVEYGVLHRFARKIREQQQQFHDRVAPN